MGTFELLLLSKGLPRSWLRPPPPAGRGRVQGRVDGQEMGSCSSRGPGTLLTLCLRLRRDRDVQEPGCCCLAGGHVRCW